MPALDSIASFQTTVGSTLAAGVMASGDSATIRNFPQNAPPALLIDVGYDDVTSPQAWRVRSPLLHDNIRGIQFTPGASAPYKLVNGFLLQPLQAQDSLIFELSTAAATGKAVAVCSIYYPNLPGTNARLHSPGDIQGAFAHLKPTYVAVGSGANTAGTWYDLVLSTTESILKANTDYAVLGIIFDQSVAAVAIKGPDTGNLRCMVPGGSNTPWSGDYFVRKSLETGLPLIPVINAANVGATFISVMSSAATGAAGTVQVVLAQLGHNITP